MTAAFESDAVAPGAQLTKGVGFVELVEAFEEAERGARAGFAMIASAERRLRDLFDIGVPKPSDHSHWGEERAVERVVAEMTRRAWSVLVDRMELRRILSIKEYDKLQRDLAHEKWPPLTLENVRQFSKQFRDKAPDMLRDAVCEVFEWLRPHERDHVHRLKTNTELEIGPKAILSGVIDTSWNLSGWHVSYYRSQNLLALERVFHALDGRGLTSKTWQSDLQTAIERVSPVGETSLFKYKACRNGNLHLSFKRLDLLAKLNACAAGKALKPEAASGWTKSDRSTRQRRAAPDTRPVEQRSEKELAFFATPPALADEVVRLADVGYNDRVLEPSAGDGALALALSRVDRASRLTCIEIHPERAATLRGLGLKVIEADFLAFEPQRTFERVVMNPPFVAGLDVRHVDHALRWLAPGGRLVAIMSAGVRFRSDHAAREFREEIDRRGGVFIDNDPDAFATSGTRVRTVTLVAGDNPERNG